MCLSTISKRVEPNDKERFAYQVYYQVTLGPSKGRLRSVFYGRGSFIDVGKWETARYIGNSRYDSIIIGNCCYNAGFHCFTNRRQAKKYVNYCKNWGDCDYSTPHTVVVRKVKVRGVHTIGEQVADNNIFTNVIVANQRKVLPLEKKK